jgi:hypothetical protein
MSMMRIFCGCATRSMDMIPALTKPRMIEIHETASSQGIIHLWTGANISQIADGFGDILRPFRSLDKAEPVRLEADPPGHRPVLRCLQRDAPLP